MEEGFDLGRSMHVVALVHRASCHPFPTRSWRFVKEGQEGRKTLGGRSMLHGPLRGLIRSFACGFTNSSCIAPERLCKNG